MICRIWKQFWSELANEMGIEILGAIPILNRRSYTTGMHTCKRRLEEKSHKLIIEEGKPVCGIDTLHAHFGREVLACAFAEQVEVEALIWLKATAPLEPTSDIGFHFLLAFLKNFRP